MYLSNMETGWHKSKTKRSKPGKARRQVSVVDTDSLAAQRAGIRQILAGTRVQASQDLGVRPVNRETDLQVTTGPVLRAQYSGAGIKPVGPPQAIRRRLNERGVQAILRSPIDREGPAKESGGASTEGECTKALAETEAGLPDVLWDTKIKRYPSGQLYGGGSSAYHGHMHMGVFGKPPLVTMKYDDVKKTWFVESVKSFVDIEVHEPVEEAYPKYMDEDAQRNNVVDNKALGVRTPPEPSGKGHWEDVALHLDQYQHGFSPDDMLWWVKGSTLFHECLHYQLYKKWFEQQWPIFKTELNERLQRLLKQYPLGPGDEEKAKRYAQVLLILILRKKGSPPSTEDAVYEKTKLKYWKRESDLIKKHFLKEKE